MSKDKKDIKKLADELVSLSVLEVNELNKILEEEHGIKAAPAQLAAAPAAAAAGGESQSEAEESKLVAVLLKDAGSQTIAVIKAIKEILDISLGDAKAFVDNIPKNIKEGVAQQEAAEIKAKLEEAGATVELV